MPTIFNVADYFLSRQDDEGDITNLKLQKLCAYAQAVSLCLLNKPLYTENIEAWRHGPVVKKLYLKYKNNGKNPIQVEDQVSEEYARTFFDDEQKFILEFTYAHYGDISAFKLRDMSHIDFNANFGSNKIINIDSIKQSFTENKLINKHLENKKKLLSVEQETYLPLENVYALLEA